MRRGSKEIRWIPWGTQYTTNMSLGALGTECTSIRPTPNKTKGQKAMARVHEAKEKAEFGKYLRSHCLKCVSCVQIWAGMRLPYILLMKVSERGRILPVNFYSFYGWTSNKIKVTQE